MNNKKICFITLVNDERIYQECLCYIKNIDIPQGYQIETLAVRNANNAANGYNQAMKDTDAKYKIYLHQDCFIIEKLFLSNILKIFEDPSIGMIGMVGSSNLPENGVWWESHKMLGAVYDNHESILREYNYKNFNPKYELGCAVDGFCISTQYDAPWLDKLFNGWHFYDVSQSIHFISKGYKVAIATQTKPWCLHDCGKLNTANYHFFRVTLLNYIHTLPQEQQKLIFA